MIHMSVDRVITCVIYVINALERRCSDGDFRIRHQLQRLGKALLRWGQGW